MKFRIVLYILSACLVICSAHIHLSHHRKIEIAKKIAAALYFGTKKKMMLPVPFAVPIPIPVFKSYQPIISDPVSISFFRVLNQGGYQMLTGSLLLFQYFFKHQIIAHKFGKLGGGLMGGYGAGIGGFGS